MEVQLCLGDISHKTTCGEWDAGCMLALREPRRFRGRSFWDFRVAAFSLQPCWKFRSLLLLRSVSYNVCAYLISICLYFVFFYLERCCVSQLLRFLIWGCVQSSCFREDFPDTEFCCISALSALFCSWLVSGVRFFFIFFCRVAQLRCAPDLVKRDWRVYRGVFLLFCLGRGFCGLTCYPFTCRVKPCYIGVWYNEIRDITNYFHVPGGSPIGRSLEVEVVQLSRDPAKVDQSFNASSLLFLPTFIRLASFACFPPNVETTASSCYRR